MRDFVRRGGFLFLLLAAFAVVLSGCGGGGGGGGSTNPPPDDTTPPDDNPLPDNVMFDATGDWILLLHSPDAGDPQSLFESEALLVTFAQAETSASMDVPGEDPFSGSVEASHYLLTRTREEPGGSVMEMIDLVLDTEDEGSGTYNASGGGQDSNAQLIVLRVVPAAFDVAGTWTLQVDGGFSEPPGHEPAGSTGPATVTVNGNEITIDEGGGRPPLTGYVAGNRALLARTWTDGPDTVSDAVVVFIDDASGMTGELYETRWNDAEQIHAGASLTFSR